VAKPSPSTLSVDAVADVIAKSPSQGHHNPLSASQPIGLRDKDDNPVCCSCRCASLALTPLNLQYLINPLVKSLRAEFQYMFSVRLKKASIIKLWLTRVANHLEQKGKWA
jgi:hypothetical protein